MTLPLWGVSPLFLKDIYDSYRIHGWQLFAFSTSRYFILLGPLFFFSVKSVITLILVPLQVITLFFALKCFSLVLVLNSFTVICLRIVFFAFILFGFLYFLSLWIYFASAHTPSASSYLCPYFICLIFKIVNCLFNCVTYC